MAPIASPLLRLVRQTLRAPSKSAALPVFVTHAVDEDREIAAAEAAGKIGPETLVVVIRNLAAEMGWTDMPARIGGGGPIHGPLS